MSLVYKRLREFKLSGMASNIEERIAFANDKQLGYLEFIELLCDDELNNRSRNSYKKRLAKARMPAYKTLEDFDFNFQPSINKKQVNDIYNGNFFDFDSYIINNEICYLLNRVKLFIGVALWCLTLMILLVFN